MVFPLNEKQGDLWILICIQMIYHTVCKHVVCLGSEKYIVPLDLTCIWKIFHIQCRGGIYLASAMLGEQSNCTWFWKTFHTLHNGVGIPPYALCLKSSDSSLKQFPHSGQWNGISPKWETMWCVWSDLQLNILPLMLHWFCLSCARNAMWLVRLDLDIHVTVHHVKFLIIKPTRCTNFSNIFLKLNSTCFRQFLCPSSGVFHRTHSNGICNTGLLTACEQEQMLLLARHKLLDVLVVNTVFWLLYTL